MDRASAFLWDFQNNVIDCTQLPLLFNISGKGKQPAKPKQAQRRAVRGVSAQQHSNYLSSHLNRLLTPDTHTYSVAPGIFPVVVSPSAWDPRHVIVQESITPHEGIPVGDYRQTSNSVLCLLCSLSHLLQPRQQQSTALLGKHNDWDSSGCRSLLLAHCFCTHRCFTPHGKYCTTSCSTTRNRIQPL
jgi:hypothetical protein